MSLRVDKNREKPYDVRNLADSDDGSHTWPWYRKALPKYFGTPVGMAYFVSQARFIWMLGSLTWHANDGGIWSTKLFFSVQVLQYLASVLEDAWRLLAAPQRKPRIRIVGDNVPRVDVTVTTCREDRDVIMDTVRGLCALDYPTDRFRVLVSDDGADGSVKHQVEELSRQIEVQLHYYTRPGNAGVKAGAKAGNMNAALAYLDSLRETPYEYCAFTDADMIMDPDWLRACLAHIVNDETVGMSVVPQRLYNIPTNDPLWQSINAQGMFDEVLRDSINCGWNSGPGTVFRRSAVADIGGFDEGAISEDIMCGFMLNGKGWRVVYCHEELQWGLAPETLAGHIAQRIKWSVGTLRNALTLNFGIRSPRLKQMRAIERFLAFSHLALPLGATVNRFFCNWVSLILVASGRCLIPPSSPQELHRLMRAFGWAMLLNRVQEVIGSTFCDYKTLRRRAEGLQWLTAYLVRSIILDMLPLSLGGTRIGFTPTAMGESDLQERNAKARPRLPRRLWTMIRYQGLWFHIVALCVTVLVLSTSIRASLKTSSSFTQTWQLLLTHALAPGSASDLHAGLAPLAYAIWPPNMPPRRELMEIDHSSSLTRVRNKGTQANGHADAQANCCHTVNVWRAKAERRKSQWDAWTWIHEVPQLASFVFGCYICFGDLMLEKT